MTDFEPTDVEQAAIARAVRCLRGYGLDEAIARSDPAYPVVDRPLLDLLEVP